MILPKDSFADSLPSFVSSFLAMTHSSCILGRTSSREVYTSEKRYSHSPCSNLFSDHGAFYTC